MGSVNTGCVCTRVRAAQVVDVDVHMCGAKRAVAVQAHMVDQRMSGAAQAVPVTEMSCSCVTTQARLVQACMVVRVRVAWAFSLHTSHLFAHATSAILFPEPSPRQGLGLHGCELQRSQKRAWRHRD